MNLKEKIKQNREAFDNRLPQEGHFERFREKLGLEEEKRIAFSLRGVMRIAAAVLILAGASVLVYNYVQQPEQNVEKTILGKVAPEYKEAEIYYTRQINENYNQLRNIDFEDEQQKNIVMQELQAMDSIYKDLSKDLVKNPNNEQIINAMIQHYQLKLDIMNQIMNQLKTMQEQNKPQEDEGKNI